MEDTSIHIECQSCGAEFSLTTDMEIDPAYCAFCGETVELDQINNSEWPTDYDEIE